MPHSDRMKMLETDFLPAFLGFAIKNAGNLNEAEELAQEIAYQCVAAINKGNITVNFEAYMWSIAHNTLKRHYRRQTVISLDSNDTFSNVMSDDIPLDEVIIKAEETDFVRIAVSRLCDMYRKTIVLFYYDGLQISETAARLNISESMVKFYLKTGKERLKETYMMNRVGEKSFNPSKFSVYKSAIDFSWVNVWDVFKRTLPQQIAHICHDGARDITEISIETGTPAVYIEEEVNLLREAGVMISPVKGKYRTNLHILKKDAAAQVKEQFTKLYEGYVPHVKDAFDKYLTELKECAVFKFDAEQNQWAWFFAQNITEFDYNGHWMSNEDYPQILSCGSMGFIFAEESDGSIWAAGCTPTALEKCTVRPCDVVAFGEYHCQKELRDERKAQVLYDIYCGIGVNGDDKAICAELVREGYVIKSGDKLMCNVAVSTAKSRALFDKINAELSPKLSLLCEPIRANIHSIVTATIPPQLKGYARGFAETWISFYAGVYLTDALYNHGFLAIPTVNPVACRIDEK